MKVGGQQAKPSRGVNYIPHRTDRILLTVLNPFQHLRLQTPNTRSQSRHSEDLETESDDNRLGHDDGTRFTKALSQAQGRRLTYAELTGKVVAAEA